MSIKSWVSKNETNLVSLIIPLEYQLAYPDNKSVKALSDRLFQNKYQIHRNKLFLQCIKINSKGKTVIKEIYPNIRDSDYCETKYNSNGIEISENFHRLTGNVFLDNDNILLKTQCYTMEKFHWNNRVDNIRWIINEENQNNIDVCKPILIVAHKQNEFEYLNDLLYSVN
ncbi:MAG: hypothetical protein Ta2E_12980 [Mycoplasmoidaceae bacterium]|nr:MAG: hypothetical protein Ta2E_12980 [Mycoplasmoidaceae bacterium]